MKLRKILSAFTLIELLVVISIIAILAGIALPVFSQVQIKGAQTKALSNAKQVGLACKVYATDNNGLFPMESGTASATAPSSTSNAQFAQLFPQYLTTESIFWQAKATECSLTAPTNADASATSTALAKGENHWAYVPNLSDTSNPSFPLIADCFSTVGADCIYSTNPTTKGGLWNGTKAVVILVDCSGSLQKVDATTYEVLTGPGSADLFANAASGTWLQSPSNTPLNPY